MKIEREDHKESTCKLYRVLKTVTKSGRFLAPERLWTMEYILLNLFRDSSKGLSAFFVSVNSLSTIIENGLLFCSLGT